ISDIQGYLEEGPLVAEVSILEPSVGTLMMLPSAGPNYACREVVYSLLKKDATGTWLWRYSQYFNWCYNNKKIKTRADASPVVQIYFPFWFFKGHIVDQKSGGVGQTYFNAVLQGNFELCFIGDVGCVYSE